MESVRNHKSRLQYLSWRSWGLIRYNSVWQNVAFLFYVGLAEQRVGPFYILDVVLFLAFSLAGTAYGYLVNDLADRKLDRKAGKSNVFQQSSRGEIVSVMGILLLLLLLLGLPFVRRSGFVPLWITWFLASTFYSLPPIRLKERGAWGLVATILAQQPLPAVMAFVALGTTWTWGVIVFILYITLRGICSDVGHQMRDRARDASAGAHTFAVAQGHGAIARLYAVSLELEALTLGAVLIGLLIDLPSVMIGEQSISPIWSLLGVYLPLLATTVGQAWRRLSRGEWVDPYDESPEGPPRDRLHFLHLTFPTVLLPLYLSMLLTWYHRLSIIFVIGLCLLYRLWDPHRWAETLPGRTVRLWLKRGEDV